MYNDYILITTFTTLLVAQFFKFLINFLLTKKIDISFLYTTGGMPSSHSALVSCMAFSIYLYYGTTNYAFPVAVALAIIVIHDAMGIRLEASKHAKVLNNLIKDADQQEELKERLGHLPIEVLMGIILGLVTAYSGYLISK